MQTGLPPGPRAPAVLQTLEWIARPARFLERCRDRHGDPFTIRILWADAPLVMVSDPEEVKRLFRGDPDVLHAGESASHLRLVAGPNSILLLDGPEHLRQRKLLLPPFHGQRMQAYAGLVADVAHRDVDTWPVGEPFPVAPHVHRITLEVIIRAVFGIEDRERVEHLRGLLDRMLDMVVSVPRMLAMSLVRKDLGPWSPWGSFRRARAAVDEVLYDQIARRRGGEGGEERDDILSLLLEARDEDGQPMSDRELRDELMTLLLAGHETTAGSLAWVLERLVRHREALARVRAEAAAGEDEYLDAVIRETHRVRPVLSVVPRKLTRPLEVAGYELPAGVHATPCIYLAHRRPDLYPDPEEFRPERFLGERAPDSYAWIPFGGGIRRCLGASFATMEMKVVLSAILSRARLRAVPGAGERIQRRSITFVPARGARIVVEELAPRAPASTPVAAAA